MSFLTLSVLPLRTLQIRIWSLQTVHFRRGQMALSCWKLVGGPLALPVGGNQLPTKRSMMTTTNRALPLQVKSEEKQNLETPEALGVSRRDAMICLPATLAAITCFSTEPAEARIIKPEIRRKIQEKLEKIREKAGLSKPKTSDEKGPSPSPPLADETFPPALPPNPLAVPQVEAILP